MFDLNPESHDELSDLLNLEHDDDVTDLNRGQSRDGVSDRWCPVGYSRRRGVGVERRSLLFTPFIGDKTNVPTSNHRRDKSE